MSNAIAKPQVWKRGVKPGTGKMPGQGGSHRVILFGHGGYDPSSPLIQVPAGQTVKVFGRFKEMMHISFMLKLVRNDKDLPAPTATFRGGDYIPDLKLAAAPEFMNRGIAASYQASLSGQSTQIITPTGANRVHLSKFLSDFPAGTEFAWASCMSEIGGSENQGMDRVHKQHAHVRENFTLLRGGAHRNRTLLEKINDAWKEMPGRKYRTK